VPNVLAAYAFDTAKFDAFSAMYNDVMLANSGLSKLEREMIAVVVSSINKCFYCLTAHGRIRACCQVIKTWRNAGDELARGGP
jgi:uncharacterized peroxidase-related enzyme